MKRFFPIVASLFVLSGAATFLLPPSSWSAEGRAEKVITRAPEKILDANLMKDLRLRPQVAVAVAFARSKPVREIAASQSASGTFRIPSTEGERPEDPPSPAPIREFDESAPASPDAAIDKGPGERRGQRLAISGTSVNFEGQSSAEALHQAGVRYYELRKTGMGNYAVSEQAPSRPIRSTAGSRVRRWIMRATSPSATASRTRRSFPASAMRDGSRVTLPVDWGKAKPPCKPVALSRQTPLRAGARTAR